MDNRKYSPNLQGLLRFAVEQTKSEDALETCAYEKMDQERRDFLQSALRTMTVDVMEEFEKAISVLEDESSPPSAKQTALAKVREYTDNLDFANNFIRVGGADILLRYLKDSDSNIRVSTIYIIAEMSQNNPFIQKYFVDQDIIPLLLSNFNESEDVASSSLHAVSSLIRNFQPGLCVFLENAGIHALLSCLKTKYTRLFIKACFIVASLSLENHLVRDEFAKQEAVTKLIRHVECVNGFDVKVETVLFALSQLTKSSECHLGDKEEAVLINVLNTIVDENCNLPQCEEIVAYANTVLENIKVLN